MGRITFQIETAWRQKCEWYTIYGLISIDSPVEDRLLPNLGIDHSNPRDGIYVPIGLRNFVCKYLVAI